MILFGFCVERCLCSVEAESLSSGKEFAIGAPTAVSRTLKPDLAHGGGLFGLGLL